MIRSRRIKIFIAIPAILAAVCKQAAGQPTINIEKYAQLETGKNVYVMPMVSFENRKGWYGELRYNYEEAETVSLHLGKSFSKEGDIIYTFTPLAGIVAGKLNGLVAGINADISWRKFFAVAASQYAISYKTSTENFFYNWSEAGYNISDHVYAGLSLQYTAQAGYQSLEPGILVGANFKNLSFPCYVFNPFRSGTYVVMGITFSIQ